jgi:hypothetical protein
MAATDTKIARLRQDVDNLKRASSSGRGMTDDVRRYGVRGDGITDDTVALRRWLASSSKHLTLPPWNYRISAALSTAVTGRQITAHGATIIASTVGQRCLEVTGAGTRIEGLGLNGQNRAPTGILITAEDCEIADGCEIENMKALTGNGLGIQAVTKGGVWIHHNKIHHIDSVGNSAWGDGPGASRAVLLQAIGGALADNIIEHNVIHDIVGEEGDGIHISTFDGSASVANQFPFPQSRTTVRDNTITDVNRRAIKVQASGTRVERNHYRHTATVALEDSQPLIDVIRSDDVTVQDNVLDARYFTGIKATGVYEGTTLTRPVTNFTCKRNRITAAPNVGDSNYGIGLDYVTFSEVADNIIYNGSTGVWVTNSSTDSVVRDNTLRGERAAGAGDTPRTGIFVQSTCTRIATDNNYGYAGGVGYLVANQSTAGRSVGNWRPRGRGVTGDPTGNLP